VGKEKALVFATGMQVNLGVISCLCGPRDCLLSDSENHASIVDSTRLAMGTTFKYRHNDMANLEELLKETTVKYKNVFIVTDGVFSMTGELAPLKEITALAKKYDAYVYVDDAHGTGVLGHRGRGTADHFNLTDEVDLIMGTFSKSFATVGGFVAGSEELINYIKHSARSFMFSAAMPPSSVGTVQAVLDLINDSNSFHEKLWANVAFMQEGLKDLGFYTYNSSTPIIPILVGDDIKAMMVTRYLEEHGVFATPVISPAVPKGEALIRTSYMASHSLEDLEYCLKIFKLVADEFDLPRTKILH
jgi:7-keto-8-aminopelargonate synthetase-like enzyme